MEWYLHVPFMIFILFKDTILFLSQILFLPSLRLDMYIVVWQTCMIKSLTILCQVTFLSPQPQFHHTMATVEGVSDP